MRFSSSILIGQHHLLDESQNNNELSFSSFYPFSSSFRLLSAAADNKHVRWLLGRDGDVSVIVIGEVDEFRSSKLLQRLMNDR